MLTKFRSLSFNRVILLGLGILVFASDGICSEGEYLLGPGDVIRVSVFEYPDLTTESRVSQAGNITFPLIGEVAIGEKTVNEAEILIASLLSEGGYIRKPQVTIIVSSFQSQKISVMGQVNKPGRYSLEESSTVMDLLALAGGVSLQTAADSATLVRKSGEKISIDLYKLFNGEFEQNHHVNGGDIIFVPLSSQFYIYGEVQRPGSYRLERNMNVAQAISAGGGLTLRGMELWPYVKRRSSNGEIEEIEVSSSDLLQANDVLYVRESWF